MIKKLIVFLCFSSLLSTHFSQALEKRLVEEAIKKIGWSKEDCWVRESKEDKDLLIISNKDLCGRGICPTYIVDNKSGLLLSEDIGGTPKFLKTFSKGRKDFFVIQTSGEEKVEVEWTFDGTVYQRSEK